VWIISSPDSDQFGGDPLVGNPNGVYGRDFVYLSMYSEVLLLNESESEIVRAFPITPAAAPGALAISPAAVYCHRAADGGEPDSLLCRIDRTTLEMTVRLFPSPAGSSFAGPDAWIPGNWTINDPVEDSPGGNLEWNDDLRLVSDTGIWTFDSVTLELLAAPG
jgi:hypothetical protein